MQKLAFFLIVIGILLLLAVSVKGFFLSDEIPLLIRIAVGIIGAGVLILIGVAIKDKMRKDKTDKFKEIER
jgi:hypothetical protein